MAIDIRHQTIYNKYCKYRQRFVYFALKPLPVFISINKIIERIGTEIMFRKKLQVLCAIVLIAASCLMIFASCAKSDENGQDSKDNNSSHTSEPQETGNATVPSKESGEQPAGSDSASESVKESSESASLPSSDTEGGDKQEPTAPKSIRILAIGNSFSTDCMEYLYNIMKSGGVEEVVLGNLYYGGCSLAQHLDFAKNDKSVYTYYKNKTGAWNTTANYTLAKALKDENWDYISFQQTSKTCGLIPTYKETLTALLDIVEEQAPNAKFVWNMTWAYQQDSTHSAFANYNNSQQKMYDMIINCVEKCIEPEKRFVCIIPCMTSIQNARTSFLGDTLTRDGYHLDNYIGRYIAGLTWFSALTGISPEKVTYNPSKSLISDDMIAVAREAVANAIKVPNSITKSKITEGKRGDGIPERDPSLILNPSDFYEADKAVAASNGVDLSKYRLYVWDYKENSYWNCTSNATITTPGSGKSTYQQNICSASKFSITDIPVGTVFVCDDGWQFRLEIYEEENKKYSGTRPSMITSNMFVLTEDFLKNCKFLAWNVSSSPKSDISDIYAQAACHLRIYLPIS